jgi:hypothetical protein
MIRGNPYGFYKLYRIVKATTSYDGIRKYFFILKTVGLIRAVGRDKSKSGFPRHLYELVPERAEDPAWWHPQIELYPDTGLGRAGYQRLTERGLKPRGGRRLKYTERGAAVPEAPTPPHPAAKPKKLKKKKIEEKPVAKPPAKKKLRPRVLKLKPKPEMKPEKAKIIVVPKAEVKKREAEGYKTIREIDGKYMMEKPE